MTTQEPMDDKEKDLPPFVKTWKQFYRLLIGWLALLILIFYAFTRYFE